jgi:hypothetical protein
LGYSGAIPGIFFQYALSCAVCINVGKPCGALWTPNLRRYYLCECMCQMLLKTPLACTLFTFASKHPPLSSTPHKRPRSVCWCVCVFVTCCVTSGTTSETRGSAHHWRKIGRDMTSVGAGCCQCRNYCRPLYYVEHGWRHDTSYLTVFGRRRTFSGISPMTCRTDV